MKYVSFFSHQPISMFVSLDFSATLPNFIFSVALPMLCNENGQSDLGTCQVIYFCHVVLNVL